MKLKRNEIETMLVAGTFSLSVRDNDPQKGDHVKHYRIRKMDGGNGFFITQRSVFPTLSELVRHYQSKYSKVLILWSTSYSLQEPGDPCITTYGKERM